MNDKIGKVQISASDEVIDLIPLAKALLKRWWLILFAAVLFGLGFYVRTKLTVAPTYRTGFTAYISSNVYGYDDTTRVVWSDISTARSLTSTYAVIITSKPVIDTAMREAGLDGSAGYPSVSVEPVNDTEIIQVTVTSGDPEVAYKVSSALETAQADYIAEVVPGSAMNVLMPTGQAYRSGPNYMRSAEMGALAGAVLMSGVLVLRVLLDNRVKDAEELERRYGIVVMGTVHDLAASGKKGYGAYGYGRKWK